MMRQTPLSKLKSGDVLLMGPFQRHIKHWTDTIIQDFTLSQYSHAAFYVHTDDVPQHIHQKYIIPYEHWVFEAKSCGNHYKPLMITPYPEDYDWQAYRVKDEHKHLIPKILQTMDSFEGDKYNFWSSYFMGAILLLPKALRRFKAWVFRQPNPLAKENAHYCSELIVDAFLGAELDIAKDLNLNKDNITAKDLQGVTFWDKVGYI